MIFELDKETIDFVCKKKLTFTQFAICLLIYKKDVAGIIKITNEVGAIGDSLIDLGDNKYRKEIDDLILRGFVIDYSKKKTYELDNLILTAAFTDGFLADVEDIAKELWDEYPKKLFVQGLEIPSTACDYEEFTEKYLRLIKNSIKEHKKIIDKLKAYKVTHAYAEMKIMNFIGSRHWEQLPDESAKSHIRIH